MKRNNSIHIIRCHGLILAVVVALCGLPEAGYCETNGSVLLLQQTPPEGGTITPDVGVHHFDLNTDVTLTAVPRPGYQFVYWLGDVSDPTSSRTIVYLDAPKIVIAAFERAEYELLGAEGGAHSASVGGAFASPADYSQGGFTGGGHGGAPSQKWALYAAETPAQDFPLTAPEPTMACLLGLGGLAVLRRRWRHQ